jgi:hypothetical protein
MLKCLILSFFFITSTALACWKVEGSFSVDGETWKINNKLDHQQEHIMPFGNFIVKIMVKPQDKKLNTLIYIVHERKNNNLVLVSKGEEDIEAGKARDIFAKGEQGQPNSIITIKLTNI